MILKEDLFPVGELNKPHGLNGEMSFSFTTDVFDQVEAPFFVIEIQGILIPFYITSYRFKSETTGLIKFEGIDTEEKARELYACALYLPKKYIDQAETTDIGLEYFIGFTVIEGSKQIGIIKDIDDSTENALFIVDSLDGETLIPVVDEYITDIDHAEKIIYMELPDGLLEL